MTRTNGIWRLPLLAVVLMPAWIGGCETDDLTGLRLTDPDTVAIAPALIASAGSATPQLGSHSAAASRTGQVWVSLTPGTVPDGGFATISNTRTGTSVPVAMANGGFDPVVVDAVAGDSLAVAIERDGGTLALMGMVVRSVRRPVVVRTDPPRRKRDVPLNARIVIVFSEPIAPAGLRLMEVLRAGSPVAGTFTLTPDGLRAEFVPAARLAPLGDYVLHVSQGVTDLDGDSLERDVAVAFTTGTVVAVASVATDPAALVMRGADLRTLEMQAILADDGSISGRFTIFYPGSGRRTSGRMKCFTIVDSTRAWLSGIVEETNGPAGIGTEFAWTMADSRQPPGGAPDSLTLAWYPGDPDWCATTPDTVAGGFRVDRRALLSGAIVINTSGAPPVRPTDPNALSRLVFVAPGQGGLRAMNVDGSGYLILSTVRGDANPSWSPDGAKLLFSSAGVSPPTRSLFMMNADGSGRVPLVVGPVQFAPQSGSDDYPSWSPDGKRIVFERSGHVIVMKTDGTGAEWFVAGQHPAWSPDGTRLVYRQDGWGLRVAFVDGSDVYMLTDSASDSRPSWSPDGRTIAFERGGGIYLVNVDGTGLRRLTLGGFAPAWSPDSRMIAYEYFGLNVISVDGSGMTRLGAGFTPSWTRAGRMPVRPAPYANLGIVGGSGQRDTIGATLADSLRVRVTRGDGTPVSGASVQWLLPAAGQSGRPSLSTYVTRTDLAGYTGVVMKLGSSLATWTVRVVVSDGSALTAGVEFSATSTPGALHHVELSGSPGGFSLAGDTLPYVAVGRDRIGSRVSGAPVTWSVSGPGTIVQADDTTGNTPFGAGAARALVRTVAEGTVTVTVASPAAAGNTASATATVVSGIVYVYWGFAPDSVVVAPGGTVGWEWTPDYSDETHNVTFEDDPTEPVSSGDQIYAVFTRTFAGAPRTIRYRCTLHSTSFAAGEVGRVIIR